MRLSKEDTDRAAALLSIVQQVANVAPSMTSLSGEAMRELKEIDDRIREDAARNRDPRLVPGQPMDQQPDPNYVKTPLDNALDGSPTVSSPPKAIPSEPMRRV